MRSDVSVFTTGNQGIETGGNDGNDGNDGNNGEQVTPPLPPVTGEQVINVTDGLLTKSEESWTVNQTPTSNSTKWVIPKQVLTQAIVADKPLRFLAKNGHEIVLPVNAAKQLQQQHQDNISIVSNVMA